MYTINLVENFLSFTLWSVDFRISSAKGKVIGDRDIRRGVSRME